MAAPRCRSPAAPEFAIKFLQRASRGWEQSPSGCEAGSRAALRWLGVWLPASSTKSLGDARRAAAHSSLPAAAPSPRQRGAQKQRRVRRGRERRTLGHSLLRLRTSGMSSRFWSPARDLGLPGLAVIQLRGTAAGHQLPPRACAGHEGLSASPAPPSHWGCLPSPAACPHFAFSGSPEEILTQGGFFTGSWGPGQARIAPSPSGQRHGQTF